MKHPIIISLDARHLATILGSLRAAQAVQQSEPLAPEILDIMTDGGTLAALDDGEVDALCERLNADGTSSDFGAEALGLLRALTIDLGDGPHDYADELSGLDVVKSEAVSLLDRAGIEAIPADALPDPDEEALASVYEAAVTLNRKA